MSEFVIGSMDYEFTEGGPRPGLGSVERLAGAGRGRSGTRTHGRSYEKLSGDWDASTLWTDAPAAVPRRQPAQAGTRRTGLVLSILSIIMLIGALCFAILPALKVSKVQVVGNTNMSGSEVVSAALIHGNEYFFKTNTRAMEKALCSSPSIAAAKVQRVFPDTIKIVITERKPVAIVLMNYEGRLEPVYVDAAGRLFASALQSGRIRNDLPVVSGSEFESYKLGMTLPEDYVQVFASLSSLEASAPALLGAFSEIRVERAAAGEPELVLYPLHHRLPVRTGAVLNEATLRSIILVLDVLGPQNSSANIAEIDFRTGTVVYRVKEGQSG